MFVRRCTLRFSDSRLPVMFHSPVSESVSTRIYFLFRYKKTGSAETVLGAGDHGQPARSRHPVARRCPPAGTSASSCSRVSGRGVRLYRRFAIPMAFVAMIPLPGRSRRHRRTERPGLRPPAPRSVVTRPSVRLDRLTSPPGHLSRRIAHGLSVLAVSMVGLTTPAQPQATGTSPSPWRGGHGSWPLGVAALRIRPLSTSFRRAEASHAFQTWQTWSASSTHPKKWDAKIGLIRI